LVAKVVPELTDDELITAMFDADPWIGKKAVTLFNERHAGDPQPSEPKHCEECFEGCPKCQGT
jgi:hypothetical protein